MSEEKVEYIDETPVKGKKKISNMTLLDMLQYELRDRMTIALGYKEKIDTAKTDVKKKYFRKKLLKNNLDAAKILTAIENITQEKAQVFENEHAPKEKTKKQEMQIDQDWLRDKIKNDPDDESCEAGSG